MSAAPGAITRAVASYDSNSQLLSVKIVNYGGAAFNLPISFSGYTLGATAKVTVLTSSAGPTAQNSLANPNAVVPTTSSLATSSLPSGLSVPAWSLVVVTIPATSSVAM